MSRTRVLPATRYVSTAFLLLAAVTPGLAQSATGSQSAPEPSQPWNLETCVTMALRRSPEARISALSITSAEAAVTRAKSGYYPNVSLDGSATAVSAGGAAAGSGSGTSASASLGVGWTFWQSGRENALSQTRSELGVTRWQHLDALQGLVEQVATDYYAVLAARELIKVAEDSLRVAQQQLDSVAWHIQNEKAADVDIYASQADAAKAELDLIDAKTQERLAVASLRNVMGLDLSVDLQVAQDTLDVAWEPPGLDDAVALARANRPDLQAQGASMSAKGYAARRARELRRPTWQLGGSAGYDLSSAAGRSSNWALSATMAWPIFDGHALSSAVDQAVVALEQARLSVLQTQLQANLDVEQALIQFQRTVERIAAGTKSVTAADKALQAARGRYDQGAVGGTQLDVITARATYTSAAATLVQARFDRQVALITIRRATGTLPVPDVPSDLENQEPPVDRNPQPN